MSDSASVRRDYQATATYLGNPHDSPIWQELADALDHAMAKHPPMHSPHEGWSVILEELEELREHVRADTGRNPEARKEAIHVISPATTTSTTSPVGSAANRASYA